MTPDRWPGTPGRGTSGSVGVPSPGTVSAVVTGLTLTVAFGLLALGVEQFWVAFVVGFAGVMPVAVGYAARHQGDGDGGDRSRTQSDAAEALQELRLRYVNGELTDAEFERRVEELLEAGPDREPDVRRVRTEAVEETA